jgi:hypothetical protein
VARRWSRTTRDGGRSKGSGGLQSRARAAQCYLESAVEEALRLTLYLTRLERSAEIVVEWESPTGSGEEPEDNMLYPGPTASFSPLSSSSHDLPKRIQPVLTVFYCFKSSYFNC